LPHTGDLGELIGREGVSKSPSKLAKEGSNNSRESVVVVVRCRRADGAGILERAVDAVEEGIFVQFGLESSRPESEGGFMVVHLGVGRDGVVGVALIESIKERISGVFAPGQGFMMGLDFSDAGIDGIKF